MVIRDAKGQWKIRVHKGADLVINAMRKEYPDLEIKKDGEFEDAIPEEREDNDSLEETLYDDNKKAIDETIIRDTINFDDDFENRT